MIFGFAGICHNRSTCTQTYAIVASSDLLGKTCFAFRFTFATGPDGTGRDGRGSIRRRARGERRGWRR